MKLIRQIITRVEKNFWLQLVLFSTFALLAFYPIFSFWFFHGWETSWLIGLTGGDFSLVNLMKSHGFVSAFNYQLFGWRPMGWYATALLFHVVIALIVSQFIGKKTNRTIGLVSGLLFLVTTAHHDVVTWGSFESLYAVQTGCFYLGLWLFDQYRSYAQRVWYAAMLLVYIIALLIRESGLLFLPLVFLFDGIIHEHIFEVPRQQWKSILIRMVKRHFVLWGAAFLYLIVRALYGGSAHDFIDERVQFRILLFHEHRYLEYIWYGLLSFGYFIGPYVIPYPVLNIIRDGVFRVFPLPGLQTYFFTGVGWGTYALFCWVVWKQKKTANTSYLRFAFFAFTAVTMFYAFAWSVKESFLATAYSWSENRWRYLGFTFFAAGVSILTSQWFTKKGIQKTKAQWMSMLLVGAYLLVNTFFLHTIQSAMYRENSLPAVRFYETFQKAFPTLTDQDRFYADRGSPGLNDFFAELATTKQSYYPLVKTLPPHWVRPELYYVLTGLVEEKPESKTVHFVDFTADRGVVDHTQTVREQLSALHPYTAIFTETPAGYEMNTPDLWPVDFRYQVTLTYSATVQSQDVDAKHQALTDFSVALTTLKEHATISVCKTMGAETEPYYDLRKELLLDGQLNNRSYWWADCRPAWLVIDLGSDMAIHGALWTSLTNPDAIPRNYRYDISNDGQTWKTVFTKKGNTQNNRIDQFDHAAHARFIRLWIDETSYRQMAVINEFVPLIGEAGYITSFYQDVPTLFHDMYARNWASVVWTTSPDNGVPPVDRTVYFPLATDGAWHEQTVVLPESEYYSVANQFLKRRLMSLSLMTPHGVSVTVDGVQITSPYAK